MGEKLSAALLHISFALSSERKLPNERQSERSEDDQTAFEAFSFSKVPWDFVECCNNDLKYSS